MSDDLITDEIIKTACAAYDQIEDSAWEPAMRAALTAVAPALVAAENEACAKIAGGEESNSGRAKYEYDGGAGEYGYTIACDRIAIAIRARQPKEPKA